MCDIFLISNLERIKTVSAYISGKRSISERELLSIYFQTPYLKVNSIFEQSCVKYTVQEMCSAFRKSRESGTVNLLL